MSHTPTSEKHRIRLLVRLVGGALVLLALVAAFGIYFVVQFFRTLASLSTDYTPWLRLVSPLALLLLWLAIWWAWLGISVIRAREWARRMLLASSRLWLMGGSVVCAWLLVVQANWQLPPAALDVFAEQADRVLSSLRVGVPLVALILGVLLPAVLRSVFSRPFIRSCFELQDPEGEERHSLSAPLLALLLMQLTTAFLFPLSLSFLEFLPLAGLLLTGKAAWLAMLLFTVLQLLLAAGLYHRKRWALLGTFSMTVALALNSLMYALLLRSQYAQANLPESGWTFLLLGGLVYALLMLEALLRFSRSSAS